MLRQLSHLVDQSHTSVRWQVLRPLTQLLVLVGLFPPFKSGYNYRFTRAYHTTGPQSTDYYFACGKTGYWHRNCPSTKQSSQRDGREMTPVAYFPYEGITDERFQGKGQRSRKRQGKWDSLQ